MEELSLSNEKNLEEQENASPLDTIIDVVTDSSLPAPIKKNLFKAVNQLCTSAIEVPIAYLEGITAEKRAETKARITLIEKSANEIASQMEFDPEYAKSAVQKFGQRIIKEQINLDRITSKAVDEIESEEEENSDVNASEKEINDDWLNTFEKEASQKSTNEMQEMFAKILAGEIRSPESYSIRTLKLLGELDSSVANLFAKFCSCCMVLQVPIQGSNSKHIIDARVCSLGGNAGNNILKDYGFSFDQLNILNEYGLIISDYNSQMGYELAVTNEQPILPFDLSRRKWVLEPTQDFESKIEVKISGVQLSRAGKELYPIIDISPNDKYRDALSAYFSSIKLKMVLVGDK